jgi:DNA (cytosine-5)-methyltransferase 1
VRSDEAAVPAQPLTAVELFAGCGGLALGLRRASFEHLAILEVDANAAETLRRNCTVAGWPREIVQQRDVRTFLPTWKPGEVDLCAAGVPCQPFSLGGLGNGHEDDRNLFPALLRAVRLLRPKVVLVENVFGLLRPTFEDYFSYILDQLKLPSIEPKKGEEWTKHWARLRSALNDASPEYAVEHRALQAANFGTAQLRRRVFIQAVSSDLQVPCGWPTETHSLEELRRAKSEGSYWDEHPGARPRERGSARAHSSSGATAGLRWRTVRDATADLGRPSRKQTLDVANHVYIAGARSYVGHTGSPLDHPAKTLKAGVHGVAGGEGTLRNGNGSVRYFTVREAARLQDFGDDYWFSDVRTTAMRQIGNAVPVRLAEALGREIAGLLCNGHRDRGGRKRR